ncbi:MAG TPA: SDR family NAD(P)-dependent oxidoreductase [Terrabacter sp.]|nr:SDR family NAD(P)-dependent oxidoreductase [Terrabacter sp.]
MSGTLPRIAVVTGGDSGIGRATALLLAAEGFDIGLTVHEDEEGARRTAADVEERGQRCAVERFEASSASGEWSSRGRAGASAR